MIWFVRHGETVWNVENKICGATDSPLTEKGHAQAIETAEKVKEMGIKADMILYSPLSRAKDTAAHISEITGIPMKEEKRLSMDYLIRLRWLVRMQLLCHLKNIYHIMLQVKI